jgi:hypothetical protein
MRKIRFFLKEPPGKPEGTFWNAARSGWKIQHRDGNHMQAKSWISKS